MPVPKGKVVHTTTYQDANLFHDLVTGHSMAGILHMLNQTPIHWFLKCQGRVQSAIYGSEFMAARTATEQIMDLRYTLLMMGVPLDGTSWMFGDNQSSYHLVCKCIAANIIYFIHVEGKFNPSDLFTKIFSWAEFWPLIQPLLFWTGETIIPDEPLPVIIKEEPRWTFSSIEGHRGPIRKGHPYPTIFLLTITTASLILLVKPS
jgi:hypothetical protein